MKFEEWWVERHGKYWRMTDADMTELREEAMAAWNGAIHAASGLIASMDNPWQEGGGTLDHANMIEDLVSTPGSDE
jgi:hypothetical protein